MNITPPCPCGNATAFGPATVIFEATDKEPRLEVQYVNCKRCSEFLVLGRDVVVHHIDGDRQNNSPDNLQVLPSQAEHARLHGRKS